MCLMYPVVVSLLCLCNCAVDQTPGQSPLPSLDHPATRQLSFSRPSSLSPMLSVPCSRRHWFRPCYCREHQQEHSSGDTRVDIPTLVCLFPFPYPPLPCGCCPTHPRPPRPALTIQLTFAIVPFGKRRMHTCKGTRPSLSISTVLSPSPPLSNDPSSHIQLPLS